jgi:hypothetical protein
LHFCASISPPHDTHSRNRTLSFSRFTSCLFAHESFKVLNHEAKAKEEAQRLAAATSAAAPALEPHHDRVLIRIYEAEDGFTGTYDEVLAHEQKMGLTSGIGHAATVQHVLGSKAGGLASFVDLFHKNGIDNASELEGCTDAFLAEKIGMSPAQVTQFRQVKPKFYCAGIKGGYRFTIYELRNLL